MSESKLSAAGFGLHAFLRLRLGMTLMLLGMTVYGLAVVMLSDSETSLYSNEINAFGVSGCASSRIRRTREAAGNIPSA